MQKEGIDISQMDVKNILASPLLMQKRVLTSAKQILKIFLHQL
jgi:hypothetical protein